VTPSGVRNEWTVECIVNLQGQLRDRGTRYARNVARKIRCCPRRTTELVKVVLVLYPR
jgi:hypothetical protein